MTLSDDEVRALLRLEQVATTGPWQRIKENERLPFVCATDRTLRIGTQHHGGVCPLADMEMIVASRNALRPLCEDVLRLREENDLREPTALEGTVALQDDEILRLRARLAAAEELAVAIGEMLFSFTGNVGPDGFMLPDYQVEAVLKALDRFKETAK